jgi:hypothetical protein
MYNCVQYYLPILKAHGVAPLWVPHAPGKLVAEPKPTELLVWLLSLRVLVARVLAGWTDVRVCELVGAARVEAKVAVSEHHTLVRAHVKFGELAPILALEVFHGGRKGWQSMSLGQEDTNEVPPLPHARAGDVAASQLVDDQIGSQAEGYSAIFVQWLVPLDVGTLFLARASARAAGVRIIFYRILHNIVLLCRILHITGCTVASSRGAAAAAAAGGGRGGRSRVGA